MLVLERGGLEGVASVSAILPRNEEMKGFRQKWQDELEALLARDGWDLTRIVGSSDDDLDPGALAVWELISTWNPADRLWLVFEREPGEGGPELWDIVATRDPTLTDRAARVARSSHPSLAEFVRAASELGRRRA